jgi:hypothetical protein
VEIQILSNIHVFELFLTPRLAAGSKHLKNSLCTWRNLKHSEMKGIWFRVVKMKCNRAPQRAAWAQELT